MCQVATHVTNSFYLTLLHPIQNVGLSLFMVLNALSYQLKLWMLYRVTGLLLCVLFLVSLNTRAFKFPHVIRVRGLRICNNRIQYALVYLRKHKKYLRFSQCNYVILKLICKYNWYIDFSTLLSLNVSNIEIILHTYNAFLT